MPQKILLIILICLGLGSLFGQYELCEEDRVCGLSFVAPPEPFASNPMPDIVGVNANWIALIPYAYSRIGQPNVRYNMSKWQWWGERPEGIEESIRLAREKGIRIMIKPQVYCPGSWPGEIDFDNEADWKSWETDYSGYIMHYARMAEKYQIEMLCIGTEFAISVQKRESYWRNLIKQIRAVYSGELIYSSNWDNFKNIRLWDELDYIGLSSYFPLSEDSTPDPKELQRAWRVPYEEIKTICRKYSKQVIFTEYGYLSVDGCAGKTWELEKRINNLEVNQQAQAIALKGLLDFWWDKPEWLGGFLWKWFPNMRGHEGYPEKDYTPQGKLAEETLKEYYGR